MGRAARAPRTAPLDVERERISSRRQ